MKRVKLDIRSNLRPDELFLGQALINELGNERLYFYATQKFPIDSELEIDCNPNGMQLHYKIIMSHLHEQISSGRVMTGLPVEGQPFPARKFYRCFGTVLSRQVLNAPAPIEGPMEGPKPEPVDNVHSINGEAAVVAAADDAVPAPAEQVAAAPVEGSPAAPAAVTEVPATPAEEPKAA